MRIDMEKLKYQTNSSLMHTSRFEFSFGLLLLVERRFRMIPWQRFLRSQRIIPPVSSD